MTLNELASKIHHVSTSKGFEPPNTSNIDQKLLLVVSEICEAQEFLRNGHDVKSEFYDSNPDDFHPHIVSKDYVEGAKPEGFGYEVADAIIRLLHICSALDLDIDTLVERKIAYNKTRPHKHGKSF